MGIGPQRDAYEAQFRLAAGPTHPRRPDGRPASVYHYTTANGLAGILASNSFYMTADDDAKDPLELVYANRVFRDAWKAVSGGDENPIRDYGPNDINPYYPLANVEAPYGIYVTAFCKDRDEPHHWQNFCEGGRGYSIGVRMVEPGQWTTSASEKARLFVGRVEYDRKKQQAAVENILRAVAAAPAPGDPLKYAARQVLGEVLPLFKHESFKTEKEWRIVATRLSGHTVEGADVEANLHLFRARLRLRRTAGPLPLQNITLGPRIPKSMRKHVEAMAAKHEHHLGDVFESAWSNR